MSRAQSHPDLWTLTAASAHDSLTLYFEPLRTLASRLSGRFGSSTSQRTRVRADNLGEGAAETEWAPALAEKIERLSEVLSHADALVKGLDEQRRELQILSEKLGQVLEGAKAARQESSQPVYSPAGSRELQPGKLLESLRELRHGRDLALSPDRLIEESLDDFRERVRELMTSLLTAQGAESRPSLKSEPDQTPAQAHELDVADLKRRFMATFEDLVAAEREDLERKLVKAAVDRAAHRPWRSPGQLALKSLRRLKEDLKKEAEK